MKGWKTVIRGCEQVSSRFLNVVTLHIEKVLIKALSLGLQSATLLFTVGNKLKNTASNFIPDFSPDSSQSDIYMHFNAVSFYPAPCNSLPITHGSINKESPLKIWNPPLNCFFLPSLTHWTNAANITWPIPSHLLTLIIRSDCTTMQTFIERHEADESGN